MRCSRSILIVDDDEDIRDALRETLEDEGHRAVAIGDGRSALNWLKQGERPPCLVLLDWNMAPMNGAQVLEAIREDPELAELPVVLVTADVRLTRSAAPASPPRSRSRSISTRSSTWSGATAVTRALDG